MLACELLRTQDLDGRMARMGDAACALTGCDSALIVLERDKGEYATDCRENPGFVNPHKQSLRKAAHAAMNNQSLFVEESYEETSRKVDLLAVPVASSGHVGAIAAVWTAASSPRAARIRLLTRLGKLAGAALDDLGAHQRLEDRIQAATEDRARVAHGHANQLAARDLAEEAVRLDSLTDALTGLWNRRGFFLRAEQSFKVAQRLRRPSALIFADIDGLKRVNDELGHEAGDRLIATGARLFKNAFRESDVIARLGGDEFAAFSLDTAQPEVIRARLEQDIERFNRQSELDYPVSMSIGVRRCDPDASSGLADYLALADEQMYARKRQRHPGRSNQAGESPP